MNDAETQALVDRVGRLVRRWLRGGLGASWVVAVSGGSDSVALLRVLHALAPDLGLTLSVAHLDHGARGAASRGDAAFVAGLARSLGLPFDPGEWSPSRPGHFESDARRGRLAFLLETAGARGASAVALGHTRDDQAETVLHRVVRGTGLKGLAGIPARRPLGPGVTLVRPLLGIPRDALRSYLAALGQPFRDDPSNADLARTRARIRHDLLPKLAADYNPAVADALARLARLASAAYRVYEDRLLELERAATAPAPAPDALALHREVLAGLPELVRAEVVRLAWRRAGWPEASMTSARWRRLAALAVARRARPARFDVGAGVVAETAADQLVLRRRRAATAPPDPGSGPQPPPGGTLPLDIPGAVAWRAGRVVITLGPDAPRDESVDLDRLHPPLSLRAPEPGDRFRPLGMTGGSQPLNDFFRGRRIRPDERARTPLVCDRLGIVWVVGHRIADRVKLTPSTSRAAGLRWEGRPSS